MKSLWYNGPYWDNMRIKTQSWMLLIILALIVAFAAGVRQGLSVEKENASRLANLLKLTPSPLPSFGYHAVIDQYCGVSYMLPDYITSASAEIDSTCDNVDGTRSASLTQNGYIQIPITNNWGYVVNDMWFRIPHNLVDLVKRTIQTISP